MMDEREMTEIMDQVRRQQEAVERIQRDVEAMQVTGRSRDDEVSATVRGSGQFTEISIDEYAARRYGVQDLSAVVLEAVNDALAKLASETAAQYAPVLELAQNSMTQNSAAENSVAGNDWR